MKKDIQIFNLIESNIGGGAELIVSGLSNMGDKKNQLIKIYLNDFRKLNFFNNSILSLFLAYFKILILISKKIDKSKKIIIHTHLSKSFYLGFIAKFFFKTRLIHTEHNTKNRRRDNFLTKNMDRLIYSAHDKIICISKGVENSLIKMYPDLKNTVIIYNGSRLFDKKSIKNIDSNKGLNLLSIGSLSYQKGFDLFLENLKKINHNLISSYTIIGEGVYKEKLLHMLKFIPHNIYLEGWKDNINYYLKKCDLLVIPSRWEGFGLVAIEALSTGTPILISDVDGLNEFSKFGNISIEVFNINNHNSLESKLKILKKNLSNNNLKLSEEAVNISSRFSFKKMNKEYLALYESI